jgi:hypothetical protein
MLDENGNIYNFGTDYLGGAGANKVAPFVSMAYTPSGKGYALMDSQGHVYTYGDSQYRGGNPAGATLPFVSIAYKPGTTGYTMMDSVGNIYNYGTDYLGGSPAGATKFTALAYTPTGRGYTLMDDVGHIYNYGDSRYKGGSPIGTVGPIRGLSYKTGTDSYTVMDAVGSIYNYGTDYRGGGPAGAVRPMAGIVYTPSGNGYALMDAVGHIYNYGDSQYRGGIDSIIGGGGPGENTGVGSTRPIGNPWTDSTGVACATGTKDVGIHDAYSNGAKFEIRLCAVSNLSSSGEESNNQFGVIGAGGKALVTSRVSGAVYAMVAAAKTQGVSLSARSSFRTMSHQKALCASDALCAGGNHTLVAAPGNSNHQSGTAIDFNGPVPSNSHATCSSRATSTSATYTWLRANAPRYGFGQYAAESWHWEALGKSACS